MTDSGNNAEIRFDQSSAGFAGGDCTDGPGGSGLRTCGSAQVTIGRNYDPILNVIAHELAHVYTLATGVAKTPGPLAIAHLYFYDLLPRSFLFLENYRLVETACAPRELLADALSLITLGEGVRGNQGYWIGCELITNKADDPGAIEAQTVVRSAVAGEMPTWLSDTYTDSEGNLELERLWAELKSIPHDNDQVAIVHQLRNAFGGYCNSNRASDSVFGKDETRNPWKVGGCTPDPPTNLSATTSGSSQVTVSWQEPLDDGGSPIQGYKFEWECEALECSSSGMKVVEDLADLQQTITDLTADQSHTVRVLAYNHNGDGEGAETTVTPTDLDTSVPELLTARLDTFEPTVRLTYNEPLDESSTPPGSAFSVSVNGTAQTPSVVVEDNVVNLTITGSLSASTVLTVTYTPPTGAGASPLKDPAGNQAMSFSGTTVRNDRTDVSFTSNPESDDTYVWNGGAGDQDAIDVTVTFSEAVIAYGEPELSLKIGDKTRRALYDRHEGENSLVFQYVVMDGDLDDDGIEVKRGQIKGLIRYASNKAVAPGGVVLGPDPNHLVDGVRAVLVSAGIVAGQSELVLTWDRALDE